MVPQALNKVKYLNDLKFCVKNHFYKITKTFKHQITERQINASQYNVLAKLLCETGSNNNKQKKNLENTY